MGQGFFQIYSNIFIVIIFSLLTACSGAGVSLAPGAADVGTTLRQGLSGDPGAGSAAATRSPAEKIENSEETPGENPSTGAGGGSGGGSTGHGVVIEHTSPLSPGNISPQTDYPKHDDFIDAWVEDLPDGKIMIRGHVELCERFGEHPGCRDFGNGETLRIVRYPDNATIDLKLKVNTYNCPKGLAARAGYFEVTLEKPGEGKGYQFMVEMPGYSHGPQPGFRGVDGAGLALQLEALPQQAVDFCKGAEFYRIQKAKTFSQEGGLLFPSMP